MKRQALLARLLSSLSLPPLAVRKFMGVVQIVGVKGRFKSVANLCLQLFI